ncbi:hypothetical protein AJ78_03128, partial [Emergomyces pasteurianus Ep9510]
GKDAPRLFTSLLELEGLGRRYSNRKLQSEKNLEHYERTAVKDHTSEESDVQLLNESSTKNLKPDSFCIHRINDFINTLITTVEYKPLHKLSVENLRSGL